MKLFYLIFLLFILSSCSSEEAVKTDRFNEWLNENRTKQNEKLIDFSYTSSNKIFSDLINVEYYKSDDTLVVWFYSTQPVGCLIIGDIEISKEIVELKIDHACNPFSDQIITEKTDLKFIYKIIDDQNLTAKTFKVIEKANLIKQYAYP